MSSNIESFVFASNEEVKTTSLLIAEKFGKRHADVLRAIVNISTQASDLFYKRNFALMFQTVEIGNGATRKSDYYELTKDGFMIIVMSFTGMKAMKIKEAYIGAFNSMQQELMQLKTAVGKQTALPNLEIPLPAGMALISIKELERLKAKQQNIFPENYRQFIELVNKMESCNYRIVKRDLLIEMKSMIDRVI